MLISRKYLEALGGFDAAFRLSGDFDLIVRAKAANIPFRYHNIEVGAFLIRKCQLSTQSEEMNAECRKIRDRWFPGPPSPFKRWKTLLFFRLRHTADYLHRTRLSGFKSADSMIRGKAGANPRIG